MLCEATESKAEDWFSMSAESGHEFSIVGVPYLTGSIIAGSSEELAIFAEGAVC